MAPLLPQPTLIETWRYVRQFLGLLTAGAAIISLGMLAYNSSTGARAEAATAALDSGDMKAAFEAVESPHMLGGWRVPDALWKADDPVMGGLDEEKLAAAAVAMDAAPQPATTSEDANKCQTAPCAVIGLGKPWARQNDGRRLMPPQRVKVFQYLMLRRSMGRGQALSEAELRFFQWNRALWVRAFRRQVMDGEGIPTASDAVIIGELQEILAASSHNGMIFGWYSLLVTAMLAAAFGMWITLRKPEDNAQATV